MENDVELPELIKAAMHELCALGAYNEYEYGDDGNSLGEDDYTILTALTGSYRAAPTVQLAIQIADLSVKVETERARERELWEIVETWKNVPEESEQLQAIYAAQSRRAHAIRTYEEIIKDGNT